MQKFIIPDIDALPCSVQISGQDAKHIFKVLRLRPDDLLTLTNGAGQDFIGRIIRCSATAVDIEVLEKRKSHTEPQLEITLCCGILKDKKMDMVIKHATQLGISKWIPFYCQRSIPRHDTKKAGHKFNRWQTIAKESVKQCRRSSLPQISMPVNFKDILNQSAEAVKFLFWEDETVKFTPPPINPPPKRVVLIIGPEGGFTVKEIEMAKAAGFGIYALGPRILRAETAAITATSLVQHLFGDL